MKKNILRLINFNLRLLCSGVVIFGMLSLSSIAFSANDIFTVDDFIKISDLEGDFPGVIPVGARFGITLANLGHLGANSPTNHAIAVGASFDGPGVVWILFLEEDGSIHSHQKIEDGVQGLVLNGGNFGSAIEPIGDLDGNGVLDIAVGELSSDEDGQNRGAVWIIYLNEDGTLTQTPFKIGSNLNGFPGGLLEFNDNFGTSLAFLGDMNNDESIELAVGSVGDDDGTGQAPGVTQAGAIYILSLNTDSNLGDLGHVLSYQKISATSGNGPELDDNDRLGQSLANIGDLDGDGIIDLASGALFDGDGGPSSGAVWIFFMNADRSVKSMQKISATEGGLEGFVEEGDRLGRSLSFLGDINGDGTIELAATADNGEGISPFPNIGSVFILSLQKNGTVKSFITISEGISGFDGNLDSSDAFGVGLSVVGDINNDGYKDLLVGAANDDDGGTNKGALYALFLKPLCDGQVATIIGTIDNDNITGTSGDDVIVALGGNDNVDAGDGNDLVCAGYGNDVVLGGQGDDTIRGQQGQDEINGNQGSDIIYGGPGFDILKGNKGHDELRGGQGNDILLGGGGQDKLLGNNGQDQLNGGAGTDECNGGDGVDIQDGLTCETIINIEL